MSSELQHKMYNYQPQPPSGCWDKIVSALDGENESLSKRFEYYQVIPPAAIWNQIVDKLDEQPKVVPLPKKGFIKYVAAAVVLGLIVYSTTLLLNSSSNRQNSTSQNNTTTKPAEIPSNTAAIEDEKLLDSPSGIDESKNTRAIAYSISKPKQIASAASLIRSPRPGLPTRLEPENRLDFSATVDRYMVYSDGKGNAMRLPKKMYDAIACVEEEITCKQRIQSLQQKMANAALTSDFTAVLELLKNVRENQ